MNDPCTRLWQSVIIQALQDALRPSNRHMDGEVNKEQAISFFEAGGEWYEHFLLCCLWAGWEPSYIREGYERARDKGNYGALLDELGRGNISVRQGGSCPKRKKPILKIRHSLPQKSS